MYNSSDGRYEWVTLPTGHTNFARNFYTDLGQLAIIPNATNVKGVVIRAASGQTANLFEWQNSTPTTLGVINSTGKVGIGTTSPAEALTLASSYKIGWEASAGSVDTNLYRSAANTLKTDDTFQAAGGFLSSDGTAGATVSCAANKGIKSVTIKNGLVTAATCTTNDLTDIAENYGASDSSIEAGDVVAASSSQNAIEVQTENGPATKAYIEKASANNPGAVIGIISTNPQIKLGEELFSGGENPRAVAISGRVQVKVNSENGAIKKGDLISVSSVAGIATKANDQSEIIIGTSLEDFSAASGKIIVFVNISHKFGTSTLPQLAQSGAIHADSLTVEGEAIFKGKVQFADEAQFKKDSTFSGTIKASEKIAGQITIPAGQSKVRVDKAWDSNPLSVILTPSFNTKVWTSEISKTGFTVNLDIVPEKNEVVSYLVIFPTE